LLMQPIHFAISLVEGFATAGVVSFIWKARPEILNLARNEQSPANLKIKNTVLVIITLTLLTGTVFTWHASEHPDGLEWSIAKITGAPEIETPSGSIHAELERVQEKTSLLPDYGFRESHTSPGHNSAGIRVGTSLSGLLGGFLVLTCAVLIGFLLKRNKQRA